MRLALTTTLVLLAGTTSMAADLDEMTDLTRDMVLRAADHYGAVGPDQAKVDFNLKSEAWYANTYHLHMFGMTQDGLVWADNVWPEFVGTDFSVAADFNGVEFGRDILDNTPQDGSVYRIELQFMNPDSGDLSPSVGACLRPDDQNILCSWTNG